MSALSAWRATLRLARRDAWAHRARSLLVIALVGLPVLALAGADLAYRTWQLSPSERLTRTIGTASAGVEWVGGHVSQIPAGFLSDNGWSGGGVENDASPPPVSALLARLPGARVIEQRSGEPAVIQTAHGIDYASLTGLDYADPIAAGLVRPVSGRAPRNGHEAAITTAMAHATGLRVGDSLRLLDPDRRLTVVGVVADPNSRGTWTVYLLPALVPVRLVEFGNPGQLTWLVDSPSPVTWQQVLALNKLGYIVVSRHAYLHPPPSSQFTFHPDNRPISGHAISLAVLVAGMALLEIVLLAGPAFAVSARRQRRQLALLAATGGRPADLRNVVLAGGVVLGVTAGVFAVLAAIGLAAVGIPLLAAHVDQVPGSFDVRPLDLAVLAAVAVVTAVAAAAFPARSAARTDVVAALAGRRGTLRTRKRVVGAGVVVGIAGVVIAIGGGARPNGATVILFGVALIELGLIACTPALIALAGRLGRRLPLAPRIALRDASRNRSAATPAVAAVMASVIGATAAILVVASAQDQNRRDYQPQLPTHAAYVQLDSVLTADRPAEATAAERALRAALPTRSVVVVRGPSASCSLAEIGCPIDDISFADQRWMTSGSRYTGGWLPATVVDDGTHLRQLFGRPEPTAAAALQAGKVVVVDRAAVAPNGTITLTGRHGRQPSPTDESSDQQISRTITVPAVVVSDGYAATQLIVPPSVARRLGVTPQPVGVFARDTRAPTDTEQQAARGALRKIDRQLYLYVEAGYHDDDAWMSYALAAVAALIAVGAAVIATALADVDGRADLVTLGAVGAAPRTRRTLSSARAAVIAGLGALLGTAAGFVPAVAWVRAEHVPASAVAAYGAAAAHAPVTLRLVVPWLPVLALLVGIPVLAAAVAGLFSRSRLPSERAPDR